MKEINIENIDEIKNWLYELSIANNGRYFFRGQKDIGWKIIPSIFRNNCKSYKACLYEDIILKLKGTFINYSKITNDIEWLMLLQHYGLPTSLLGQKIY